MSEAIVNNGFNVPPDQDFNTVTFQGSMQQVLQENIGNYVIVEFLIGTNSLISRQGILYNVSTQFLVLFDEIESRYVVCDIFSVKFVTFLLPGNKTAQAPYFYSAAPMPTPAAPQASPAPQIQTQPTFNPVHEDPDAAAVTPSQAAYAWTTRRTPPRG